MSITDTIRAASAEIDGADVKIANPASTPNLPVIIEPKPMTEDDARHLDTLAEYISSHVGKMMRAIASFEYHRLRAAQGLVQAKAIVPPGRWLKWCEENVKPPRSARDIQRLLKIAGAADPEAALQADRKAAREGMKAKRAKDATNVSRIEIADAEFAEVGPTATAASPSHGARGPDEFLKQQMFFQVVQEAGNLAASMATMSESLQSASIIESMIGPAKQVADEWKKTANNLIAKRAELEELRVAAGREPRAKSEIPDATSIGLPSGQDDNFRMNEFARRAQGGGDTAAYLRELAGSLRHPDHFKALMALVERVRDEWGALLGEMTGMLAAHDAKQAPLDKAA